MRGAGKGCDVTADHAKAKAKRPQDVPTKTFTVNDPNLLFSTEAASQISKQQGHTEDQAKQLAKAMRAAIFAGELGIYDRRTGLLIPPPSKETDVLFVRLADVHDWLQSPSYKARLRSTALDQSHAVGAAIVDAPSRSETSEARQARRYEMCVDAGLKMPTTDYGLMPWGIGRIAAQEQITRQAFTEDLKVHIRRTFMH